MNQSSVKSSNATQFVRSHGAHGAAHAVRTVHPPHVPAAIGTGRSILPPPVPSAARAARDESATMLSLHPVELPRALATNTLFDPITAQQPSKSAFWLRIGAVSVGAGLLIASGYLGAMASLEARASHAPRLIEVHASAAAQPSAAELHDDMALPAHVTAAPVTLTTVAPSAPSISAPATKSESKRSDATHGHAARRSALAKLSHVKAPVVDEQDESDDSAPVAVAAGPTLPAQLPREAVRSGLESVRAQLAACAAGAHGTMFANVSIAGSGHVSYTTIEGAFAGTPAGSCMARALRSPSFPKFSASSLKVRYPFSL